MTVEYILLRHVIELNDIIEFECLRILLKFIAMYIIWRVHIHIHIQIPYTHGLVARVHSYNIVCTFAHAADKYRVCASCVMARLTQRDVM